MLNVWKESYLYEVEENELFEILNSWQSANNPVLGSHVSHHYSLIETIQRTLKEYQKCAQITLILSHTLSINQVYEEALYTKQLLSSVNFPLFCHSNVCHNMASSVKGPTDPSYHYKRNKVLDEMLDDLDLMAMCGGKGVVIHFGKCQDKVWGWQEMLTNVQHCLTAKSRYSDLLLTNHQKKRIIILENSAQKGNCIGGGLQYFRQFMHKLPIRFHIQIKFCVDTCHLSDSLDDDLDVGCLSSLRDFFSSFSNEFGLDKLAVIHLNDSKYPIGSRKDNHASISDGYIWKENQDSLKWLLNFSQDEQIPLVLETPAEHNSEIVILAAFHQGKCK